MSPPLLVLLPVYIVSALKIPENLDVDHAAILLQVVRDLGLKEKEREVIGKIEAQVMG